MQQYTRLATPRFRRITIRFSSIEIELRARPQPAQEQMSREERAYRRARAEETIARQRDEAAATIAKLGRCWPWI